jgi:Ca2+-binding RTX toxin-like protein
MSMSTGYQNGNAWDDDKFDFSFNHHHDFWFFGQLWNHHDHHGGGGLHIAVQGNQWVLTDGHHTHVIAGDSVVLHGETYLLVDQFGGGYQSIQAAVDAANPGATILVASGIYAEQVLIAGAGKNGLTIEAADDNNVVITAPATLVKTADAPGTGRDIVGLVTVDGADNVTIKDVTVDGAQRGGDVPAGDNPTLVGIAYVNSDGGVIDHVDVTGVRESEAAFGIQRGVGIYVTNDDPSATLPHTPSETEAASLNSIVIKYSTVEDFQKGAIVVTYADVDIHDNTVTGHGPTPLTAQNGIQVANSTGSIEDNDIGAIGYTGASNAAASGILTFQNRDLTVLDNTITGSGQSDSVTGIFDIDSVGGHITGNTISNVLYAIDAEDYPTAFGWPDPLLPGGPHGHNFDFSGNDVSSVYAGMWFQPDAATTDPFKVTGTTGDDAIFGAAGNDTLNGGKGSDYLSGEGGNDKLTGGLGGDESAGGAGNDTFIFTATADSKPGVGNFDLVDDFTAGDKIDLSAIDANMNHFGNQTFGFVAGPTSGVVADKVTWYQDIANNQTIIQADNNGNAVADVEIHLAGLTTLTAGNFIL